MYLLKKQNTLQLCDFYRLFFNIYSIVTLSLIFLSNHYQENDIFSLNADKLVF